MPHVVVNDISPRVAYSPTTGTSYTIPSTWGFFASSDIIVYSGTTQLSYNAAPSSSTQFATSGSAVDGGFQGGNIVLGAASTANTILLSLDVPIDRQTDFPYPAATVNIQSLNTDLDKALVISQQNTRDLARALLQDTADTGAIGDLGLYSERANKFLSFDSSGVVSLTTLTLSGTTATIASFMTTFLNSSTAAQARTNLDVVEDVTTTAGDMLYRDSTGVTRLALGATTNSILASTSATPAWTTLSALLDGIFSSTQGAILYRGTSQWASLAAGTSSQVLTTYGSGANPAWVTSSSKFKQIVAQSTATVVSTNTDIPSTGGVPSSTMGVQLVSVSITPASTANRLRIEGMTFARETNGQMIGLALFSDQTGTTALAAMAFNAVSAALNDGVIMHDMAAPSTAATSFSLRIGRSGAGVGTTSTVEAGTTGSAASFGSVSKVGFISVLEYST